MIKGGLCFIIFMYWCDLCWTADPCIYTDPMDIWCLGGGIWGHKYNHMVLFGLWIGIIWPQSWTLIFYLPASRYLFCSCVDMVLLFVVSEKAKSSPHQKVGKKVFPWPEHDQSYKRQLFLANQRQYFVRDVGNDSLLHLPSPSYSYRYTTATLNYLGDPFSSFFFSFYFWFSWIRQVFSYGIYIKYQDHDQ